MKKLFLILTILGLALNLTTMWNETVNHGNFLLWGDFDRTTAGAFATEISSIFMYDLFYVVLVFSIWLVWDGKKLNMKHPWLVIVWTLVFGLAVSFPYYLYKREIAKEKLPKN